jgi:hypothetical protein
MSLDKLIQAATDYFTTGAEVHRAALAGGNGVIKSVSATLQPEAATKKVAAKATKPTAVETPADEPANAAEAAAIAAENKALLAAKEADIKAAAEVQAPAPAPAPADDLDGPAINYEEDIRPLLRSKSLANRDALVALLAKHGVKTGQELTADQYPSFLAALKAL